jgi:hypothetical protein
MAQVATLAGQIGALEAATPVGSQSRIVTPGNNVQEVGLAEDRPLPRAPSKDRSRGENI